MDVSRLYLYLTINNNTMKELAFTIAQRIATDKNPNTVVICASILKEAFIADGIPSKEANTMAIDGVKVIMRTMLRMA